MKMKFRVFIFAVCFVVLFSHSNNVLAALDPRTWTNNKVGIGILTPEAEISEAARMVNSNGDWGWVVLIIKKSEMNVDRWQGVFNQLSKNHLIPIVRIATEPDPGGFWQKPQEGDAQEWAEFLSKLYWPTKNRYVQIYNEVNHAGEWGDQVDPEGYAKELDKTTKLLKERSADFFILNSPLDLAAQNTTTSADAGYFLEAMNNSVGGIFKEVDGWASHSYPNPNFSADPLTPGRLGTSGYLWETSKLASFGVSDLPVFITETGWKRSSLLDDEVIASYYKEAFEKVWNDKNVVAVCPFVFDYKDPLFSAFSFKTKSDVLGEKYFKYFDTIVNLVKMHGDPKRDDLTSDLEINMPLVIIDGSSEKASVTIKNAGNYIWNVNNGFDVQINSKDIKVGGIKWDKSEIYPGDEAKMSFLITSNVSKKIDLTINIIDNSKVLASKTVGVKSESVISWVFEMLRAL